MTVAHAKGMLWGKQPKLSEKQQQEFCRLHATGNYSIADLAEVFAVSRLTAYRILNRESPCLSIQAVSCSALLLTG